MKPWEIERKKNRLISELLSARNQMIVLAYRAVGSGQTLAQLAKSLKEVQLKNYPKTIENMRSRVLHFSKKAKAIVPPDEEPDIIFPLVWRYFERNKIAQQIKQKDIYPTAQKFEEREKKAYIRVLLEKPDMPYGLGQEKIFFLCSAHGDCAEDHLEWQGRLYVDKDWRKQVSDNMQKQKIQEFISANQIKKFQWVIGNPVWLITRPNCRHYFQPLTSEEAMSKSVPELISEYDMYHDIGVRAGMQSIRHPINKGWYTKSNVLSILNQYLERLRLHKAMYEEQPNAEILSQIRKDRVLVERWRKYLKANFQ